MGSANPSFWPMSRSLGVAIRAAAVPRAGVWGVCTPATTGDALGVPAPGVAPNGVCEIPVPTGTVVVVVVAAVVVVVVVVVDVVVVVGWGGGSGNGMIGGGRVGGVGHARRAAG